MMMGKEQRGKQRAFCSVSTGIFKRYVWKIAYEEIERESEKCMLAFQQ